VAATIGLRDTDDEGTTVLWNAGTYLFNYSGTHPGGFETSHTSGKTSQCHSKEYMADSIYFQCSFSRPDSRVKMRRFIDVSGKTTPLSWGCAGGLVEPKLN